MNQPTIPTRPLNPYQRDYIHRRANQIAQDADRLLQTLRAHRHDTAAELGHQIRDHAQSIADATRP